MGATKTIPLRSINAIVGVNTAGKTRILNAVRLALLGYLPELGKAPRDAFALFSTRRGAVGVEFDTGLKISREWELKGNSVTCRSEVPEEIKELGDLTVMLDANAYFALSDRKRIEYVAAHCRGSSMPVSDVVAKVVGLIDAEGTTEAFRDRIMARGGVTDPSENAGDVVARWIEGVAVEVSDAKKAVQRTEKTLQQLTDMRLRDDPLPSLEPLQAEREKLRKEVDELLEQKGRLMGDYNAMLQARGRRAAITRDLSAADQASAQVEELKRRLGEERAVFSLLKDVTLEMLANAQTKVLSLKNDVLNATQTLRTLRERHTAIMRAVADLDGQTKCPYCGAEGDGWKAFKAAEYVTEQDALEQKVYEAERALEATQKELNEAVLEQGALLLDQRQARDAASSIETLEKQIQQQQGVLLRAATLREEFNRLPAENPELMAKVETVQTTINVKQDELRRVESDLQALAGRAHELKRLADAEKERDAAQIEQKVAETVLKELKAIQAKLVAEAFAPLLARANMIVGRILKGPLAYNENEGGEIGMWQEGVWTSHRTFSGAEKALTYAAIQAALAMSAPFKLMAIDELGRMDGGTLRLLVEAVVEAVNGGLIDQFVGIDTATRHAYMDASSDFQLIEIS